MRATSGSSCSSAEPDHTCGFGQHRRIVTGDLYADRFRLAAVIHALQ
jgi:hypothetical protein